LKQDECLRCNKKWYRRKPEKPIVCPRCGSPYWDKPRLKDAEVIEKNLSGNNDER